MPGEPPRSRIEVSALSIDQQHVALPKLYGAPAYARPTVPVEPAPRPFDPDALPIEASMSDEERAFASSLPARAYAPGGSVPPASQDTVTAGSLRARPFRLRSIAGRLIRGERAAR